MRDRGRGACGGRGRGRGRAEQRRGAWLRRGQRGWAGRGRLLLLERRRIRERRMEGGMEEKACGGGQRGSRLAASRWAGGARPGLGAAQRTSSRAGARDRGRGAEGEGESVTWGNSRRGPNAGHGVRDVVSGSSRHRPRSATRPLAVFSDAPMHPRTRRVQPASSSRRF